MASVEGTSVSLARVRDESSSVRRLTFSGCLKRPAQAAAAPDLLLLLPVALVGVEAGAQGEAASFVREGDAEEIAFVAAGDAAEAAVLEVVA